MQYNIMSVSQVNKYLKYTIDNDSSLKQVQIKGEISNFVDHKKTGHFYFTLKDNNSSIKAIMFNSYTKNINFEIENGMEVVVKGNISFFERDGICQIYCESIKPSGEGALYLSYEKLKLKLFNMGYFDEKNKKPLPAFPKNIGIITSDSGAALQDIINIISRRYPICKLYVIPTIVQGENAPLSICRSIQYANTLNFIDVIILGRGGGSIEDLWAFNSEIVANEIYNSNIPIVSAVGHETDFTISDFVADLRAPTPSAAAEIVTPNKDCLFDTIERYSNILYNLVNNKMYAYNSTISNLYLKLSNMSPYNDLKQKYKTVYDIKQRLVLGFNNLYSNKVDSFMNSVSSLDLLSPLKVINRGYSITFFKDNIVNSVDDVSIGKNIKVKLKDGHIIGEVNSIVKEEQL